MAESLTITSADVSALLGKPAYWWSADRNRKALYARGFPQPLLRGRWLRSAVIAWIEREGAKERDAPVSAAAPEAFDAVMERTRALMARSRRRKQAA